MYKPEWMPAQPTSQATDDPYERVDRIVPAVGERAWVDEEEDTEEVTTPAKCDVNGDDAAEVQVL